MTAGRARRTMHTWINRGGMHATIFNFAYGCRRLAGLGQRSAGCPPANDAPLLRAAPNLRAGRSIPSSRHDGLGIVSDCVRPIMMGTLRASAPRKPLPAVDPALVAACWARNPTYGHASTQPRDGQPPAPHAPRAPGAAPQAAPPSSEDEALPQDEPPQRNKPAPTHTLDTAILDDYRSPHPGRDPASVRATPSKRPFCDSRHTLCA